MNTVRKLQGLLWTGALTAFVLVQTAGRIRWGG